jgi:cis-3-alkyl-4-acyloxetan-2-one decarboxylase
MFPQKLGREYPFTSNYLSIDYLPHGENQLHYVDEGEGDPILMLHGNPTWSYYYRNLINEFKSNHRVVVPDHIGSGASKRPKKWSYDLDGHITNVENLVEHLQLKNITLVVHDWGGAIGFGFATRHPELIKRIVILNTAAFHTPDVPKRIKMLRTPVIGEFLMRRMNMFAWPATFMATEKGLSEDVKKGYLWPVQNYDQRIGVSRFVQDIPIASSHRSYGTLKSIEENLETLDCPKLILWGGKDFCFHDDFFNRWLEIYPDARFRYMNDAGHYVIEDAKEECIAEISKFLEDTH